MNGVYFYFVNKLFLVGRYWDFNSLPNNKILDLFKLKAFADEKVHVAQNMKFANEWVDAFCG